MCKVYCVMVPYPPIMCHYLCTTIPSDLPLTLIVPFCFRNFCFVIKVQRFVCMDIVYSLALFLYILLMNDIIGYLSPISMIPFSTVYILTKGKASFFFLTANTPLCVYTNFHTTFICCGTVELLSDLGCCK